MVVGQGAEAGLVARLAELKLGRRRMLRPDARYERQTARLACPCMLAAAPRNHDPIIRSHFHPFCSLSTEAPNFKPSLPLGEDFLTGSAWAPSNDRCRCQHPNDWSESKPRRVKAVEVRV